MLFVKYLRDGVRSGAITTTVRVWQRPHVRVGKRYRMEDGELEIDSIVPISLHAVDLELARACGFKDVEALLRVAQHGPGENVYVIRFHYIPARPPAAARQSHRSGPRKSPAPRRRS